jgi:four helix bundle protein
MAFKFEKLDVWRLAIGYVDLVYSAAQRLPREEDYNLKVQWKRAAISIALNIAEGSTSQSDPEQARFLGYAIRSLMECVACVRISEARRYPVSTEDLAGLERQSRMLAAKLHSFKKSLSRSRRPLP